MDYLAEAKRFVEPARSASTPEVMSQDLFWRSGVLTKRSPNCDQPPEEPKNAN